MRPYLDLVRDVIERGERRMDRTGVGTLAVFGAQTRYDLRDGFPIVTTKKVLFSAVVRELLWFLRGATNINDDLTQHTPIWDAWADADGELGPIYGFQWRHWGGTPGGAGGAGGAGGIDQIQQALDQIRDNPASRRIIVSAWNVADVPKMKLPPCHAFFQLHVGGIDDAHPRGQWLDLQLYQRSADLALGVPFNIASYALLQSMMAQECGLVARHFVHTLGDAHVYLNHVEGLKTQLAREPMPLPRLVLAAKPTLAQTFDDIALEGYQHHPFIRFAVAV
ncbi:MAG: thymidylate synthase [Kofleriaceae bacterium]|nr:thymidylate synthase [Myxococcales bacterium]MCB9561608.1 thymidylate synthase [Kofleriaceae bacterium]MCB9572996.1 thymidylate synthase [Kofleriaceae bacterium]